MTAPVPIDPGAATPEALLPFGWSGAELPFLVALPLLLLLSGSISASETALFGLTADERLRLRDGGSVGGRAADRLLADPSQLLITVLLANTTVNVLYFVLSSILLLRSDTGALGQALLGAATLLLIVLGGEVLPKVSAGAARMRAATLLAPPLFAFHRLITPVRRGCATFVIGPLRRLAAPHGPPPALAGRELRSLVAMSARDGVLDADERAVLDDLLRLRERLVRDVMLPRVRMPAIPRTATRRDVRAQLERARTALMPVYDGKLDRIVGILNAKRFLLSPVARTVDDPHVMRPAAFVPEVANLEQLLLFFRQRHARVAIVVDEYGGTAGVVRLEDVVAEVVGGGSDAHEASTAPRIVGLGRFSVPGDMGLHEFHEAFELPESPTRAATVSGLVSALLGRAPVSGDAVEIPGARLEVLRVARARCVSVAVELRPAPSAEEASS